LQLGVDCTVQQYATVKAGITVFFISKMDDPTNRIMLWLQRASDIRRGQGLVIDSAATQATGVLAFRSVTCTGNTYGISSLKQYNLTLNTCKVCALSDLARWLCRSHCRSKQGGMVGGLQAHEVFLMSHTPPFLNLRGCQLEVSHMLKIPGVAHSSI
jgi:hypothetical protein